MTNQTLIANDLIRELNLKPHPEGGYYRETYRCDESVALGALHPRYGAPRSISTAIYYMLTESDFSAMHKVASDEVYHFYAGDPLEVLLLLPDGSWRTHMLGSDVTAGQTPQLVIQRGWWQGSRVAPGGAYTLIGATVAPGFDFADFQMGNRRELCEQYPETATLIRQLTRD